MFGPGYDIVLVWRCMHTCMHVPHFILAANAAKDPLCEGSFLAPKWLMKLRKESRGAHHLDLVQPTIINDNQTDITISVGPSKLPRSCLRARLSFKHLAAGLAPGVLAACWPTYTHLVAAPRVASRLLRPSPQGGASQRRPLPGAPVEFAGRPIQAGVFLCIC
jgi:hypothetical protein